MAPTNITVDLNENRNAELISVAVVFTTLSLLAIIARQVSRRLRRQRMTVDNALLVLAWIVALSESVMFTASTRFAKSGYHRQGGGVVKYLGVIQSSFCKNTERPTCDPPSCLIVSFSFFLPLVHALSVSDMTQNAQVPIAIVGIGCRFPGGANSLGELWNMLTEERDAWSEAPPDRFNENAFYHPNQDINGTISHRGGHFLDTDISRFDPPFFGISSIEAQTMDPQQRLQLETAYEALENAGITPSHIRGTCTSVYVAVFGRDYDRMMYKDVDNIGKYHMTGTGEALLSNRISYVFDLKGPSMTIDTGCSGSMVALHSACRSIETGESSLALVGASNLILSPDQMVPMTLLHILNAEGRSFAFDHRGSGYGRGEGAACLVLKRLDAAIRDGDPVRAVIRGTGVNQDGKTAGIALPNQQAQEQLARSVCERAALNPQDVGYVEAHGTGTIAGDQIETASICSVFCESRPTDTPLVIGSIKTNIGHLESASGIAAIIKTVLMLEKGLIPASINFEKLKPDIVLESDKIRIARALEDSPAPTGGERLASVNSFGYGGTNAHAVLASYTGHGDSHSLADPNRKVNGYSPLEGMGRRSECKPLQKVKNTSELLVFTANSAKALVNQMKRFQCWASRCDIDEGKLRSLAYTLCSRRALMGFRRCIVVPAPDQLLPALQTAALSATQAARNVRIAFIFTGQGAQWVGMGRELMMTDSAFGSSLRMSDDVLQALGSSLRISDELLLEEAASRIHQSEIAQPAVTALQLALIDLLKSCGITPEAVVGHSSGEIAAAYAAGALTRTDAMRASYHRAFISSVAREHKIKGAMMAVGLGEVETRKMMQLTTCAADSIQVACVNSPESTTVSGNEDSIQVFQSVLEERNIFHRRLTVDTAYHSFHMQRVAGEYQKRLNGMDNGTTTKARFVSSVTGEEKSAEFGADYWVKNLVSTVRFSNALAAVDDVMAAPDEKNDPEATRVFIEIGPHGALQAPSKQTFKARPSPPAERVYVPTLVRGKNAVSAILETAGKLFELGAGVRFEGLPATGSRHVLRDLPPYAWDHDKTYWHESRLSKDHRFRQFPYHDLLGIRTPSSSPISPVWRNMISLHRLPWLQDHAIDHLIIFPGSGYVCMAIEALRQILVVRNITKPAQEFVLRDVAFLKALVVPAPPAEVEMQISLHGHRSSADHLFSGWEEFRISSVSAEGVWTEHCRGLIACQFETSPADHDEVRQQDLRCWAAADQTIPRSDFQDMDAQSFYEQCNVVGNNYGPTFANLQRFGAKGLRAFATMHIPDIAQYMPSGAMQPHIIHPTTLDTIMHATLPLYLRHCSRGSMMPVSIDELSISTSVLHMPSIALQVATTLRPSSTRSATVDTWAFQTFNCDTPLRLLRASNWELRGLGDVGPSDLDASSERMMCYRMQWRPDITFNVENLPTVSDTAVDSLAMERKTSLLNSSACLYIEQLLVELETSDSTIEALHHRLLVDWMINFARSPLFKGFTASSLEAAAVVHERAADTGLEGQIIKRTGSRLLEIVTGRTDALALLLEDDLLYRVYAEDSMACCYSHLAQYLQGYTFKKPYLKVLEIGAGTGATAQVLLETHSKNADLLFESYHYTDISSGFFSRAKTRFDQWKDVMSFKILDIEKDPVVQGFNSCEYDLIIASNVLHATKSLTQSISNVRRLLKPGGRLALIEEMQLTPAHMVTFGLLPGWWAGVDDGRAQGPLIGKSQWNQVLSKNGFTGTTFVKDDFEGPGHRSSLIISETSEPALNGSIVAEHPSIRFIAPDLTATASDFRNAFFFNLDAQGMHPVVVDWPCTHDIDDSTYVLLDIGRQSMLLEPSEVVFSHISDLMMRASKVLWIIGGSATGVAESATWGLVTGFARIARAENHSLHLSVFDIQQDIWSGQTSLVQAVSNILQNVHKGPTEPADDMDHIFRDGCLLVPRLIPDIEVNAAARASGTEQKISTSQFHEPNRPLRLGVGKPGLLDTLHFTDDVILAEPLGRDEVIIHTEAHGINFKDVFIALGQMKPGVYMCGECSGTIVAVGEDCKELRIGERVCAFDAQPFASHAKVSITNVHRIPDSMSFMQAASIPVVFTTAYCGLVDIARLKHGQSVLIHCAAGGVGQAAIKLAQYIGAVIYATVGTDTKKQLLVSHYLIPESHIFSSRTRHFKTGILRLTNGRGVDVVLNSLAGESLQASWSCVAPFGTFVEIGKSDIYKKGSLRMDVFDRGVTFASVDLSFMSKVRPTAIQRLMEDVFRLFDGGKLTPIQPITTFDVGEIKRAFRFIQSGKHSGKVVLLSQKNSIVKSLNARSSDLQLSRNGTYVIAGGLGDLGGRIACFFAQHGAGGILLLSRRDPQAANPNLLSEIGSYGSQVEVVQCDITDKEAVAIVMSSKRDTMPPVRGVIQAAMVLEDHLIGQMTTDHWRIAVSPKVQGTLNLLEALHHTQLDFVVMLSSITTIVSMQGQANYAAGNSFQDYLANIHSDPRTQIVSLNLTVIEDSDVIKTRPELLQQLTHGGCIPMKTDNVLSLLNYVLGPDGREANIRQLVIGTDRQSAAENAIISRDPMFRSLPYIRDKSDQAVDLGPSKSIEVQLREAASHQEVLALIISSTKDKIANLMALDGASIPIDKPIADLGMDSLIAIELKNWISGKMKAAVQTSEILDMPSLTVLTGAILERSALVTGKTVDTSQVGHDSKEVHEIVANPADAGVGGQPQLPLPTLEATADLYLESVESFCDAQQLLKTKKAISSFLEKGGLGQELQKRLVARTKDASIDAWQFDLYTDHVYRKNRAPVNPFQHFGAGFKVECEQSTSQAEQAARVAAAVYEFKLRIDEGLEPDRLNDQKLCMSSVDWIFNCSREPHREKDIVKKYPSSNHCIVLRNGHIFQVSLEDNKSPATWQQLVEVFSAILSASSSTTDALAPLTADDRDRWTENRELLKSSSEHNMNVLQVIESSVFNVCLDDDAPVGATERWNQFLLKDTANRWSDKTFQVVVCSNRASAILAEHSLIDGGSMQQLNQHIYSRLSECGTSKKISIDDRSNDGGSLLNGDSTMKLPPSFQTLKFENVPFLVQEARRVQHDFESMTRPLASEIGNYVFTSLSESIFRRNGYAPRAACQVVVQLAAKIYFGKQVPSWETVSMRSFRRGRVEIIQTVVPSMYEFCSACFQDRKDSVNHRLELCKLFQAATQAHTANVTRASRGRGFSGHLYALQEVLREGEALPHIFTDPTYQRTRPAKLMTDCVDWTNGYFTEGGWVMPDPDHVWVHYEVTTDSTVFFVKAPSGRVEIFYQALQKAVNIIANLQG